MNTLRKIAKTVVPVFLMVVICYLANATLNQHSHLLASGVVVQHAHPFEKGNAGNPLEGHHHTSSELILLDQISVSVFWIYLFIILVSPIFFAFADIIIRELSVFIHPDLYFLRNYHAPPETS